MQGCRDLTLISYTVYVCVSGAIQLQNENKYHIITCSAETQENPKREKSLLQNNGPYTICPL